MESPAVEVVDSALCAGMKDPRERAALFRLENSYKDFLSSQSYWMEVGGAYNRCVIWGPTEPGVASAEVSPQQVQQQAAAGHQTSFHRLLVHRLADRFGIRRESRSPNTIRLYKCPESRIPPALLQDLDPAVYYPPTEPTLTSNGVGSTMMNGGSPSPLDPSAANKETPVIEKQPKKKIMLKKRAPGQSVLLRKSSQQSTGSRASDFSASRSSSSDHLEAKERAYAEARARIFNEEQQQETTTTTLQEETASETLLDYAMEKLALQAPTGETTTDTSNNNGSSSYIDLSPEDRKAVYRNRAEEAADPDFQRGRIRAPVVMGPIPAVAYNAQFYPSPQYGGMGGSLTASAREFVPGGSGSSSSYLGAASPAQGAWASPPQPVRTKTAAAAPVPQYNTAQHQQPRGAWGQFPQQQVVLPTASPQAAAAARKQNYQKQRPGSFSPDPQKVVVSNNNNHRPLSAPPTTMAANATNQTAPAASTVVFPA